MTRYFILSLLLSLQFLPAKSQPALEQIRADFFEIGNDSCGALQLFESLKNENYSSPLIRAYAGASEAAAATCVKGAFNKLEYFSRGKKNLEAAIEMDSKNAEIRFLRFATQANAPNFLEYDNIKEDKALILEQLPALLKQDSNHDFWLKAADFMLASEKLSKNESAGLKELIK